MIGTGWASARNLKGTPLRPAPFAAALLLAATCLSVPLPAAAGEGVPSPSLRVDKVIYNVEAGVLQYVFTFANPSDSVLFLDCQVPPRASLSGSTLVLDFDRKALPAPGAADSAAAQPGGAMAGGPTAGGSVDAKDFPPQRVGARQTFQGSRRLDRVLGGYQARPEFKSLQLRMAYYPERESGDGEPFVAEAQRRIAGLAVTVVRKGNASAPPKVIRRRVPAPG